MTDKYKFERVGPDKWVGYILGKSVTIRKGHRGLYVATFGARYHGFDQIEDWNWGNLIRGVQHAIAGQSDTLRRKRDRSHTAMARARFPRR